MRFSYRLSSQLAVFLLALSILAGCGSRESETLYEVDTDIATDLTYTGSEALSFATMFHMDFYENENKTYTLLTMSDGDRFLIVPEGEQTPDGLSEDIVALNSQAGNIYLVASAAMDMFVSLDALDHIRFVGTDIEGWYIEEAVSAMDSGDILYAGKYSEPDYELLVSQGCNLAIENAMITHSPEAKEQLENLGIPVLVDMASYENEPLGRVEWVKVYGALTGRLDQAREIFDEQVKLQNQVLENAATLEGEPQTVAFFYIANNGAANVRTSTDYISKMIELAGGKYAFENIGDVDSRKSTQTIQFEEFYATAKDADILIYNSSIAGDIETIDDLIAINPLFSEFKAVKEGRVYCTSQNMYQESMSLATIMSDFQKIMMGEEDMLYVAKVRE